MKLILLGSPGAGKGTQAEIISERFSIPIISTGNIMREEIKNQTELGTLAKSYIDEGKLVPDDVVIGIINNRLNMADCADGYILDGVPRTVAQAKALDEMGILFDRVISIEVPDENILERMTGRRVCPDCGNSYHVAHKKPKVEGICDRCNAKVVTRNDDKEETVKERLHVYHELTEPLKDYYKKLGKLKIVEGVGEISDVSRRVFLAIEG